MRLDPNNQWKTQEIPQKNLQRKMESKEEPSEQQTEQERDRLRSSSSSSSRRPRRVMYIFHFILLCCCFFKVQTKNFFRDEILTLTTSISLSEYAFCDLFLFIYQQRDPLDLDHLVLQMQELSSSGATHRHVILKEAEESLRYDYESTQLSPILDQLDPSKHCLGYLYIM